MTAAMIALRAKLPTEVPGLNMSDAAWFKKQQATSGLMALSNHIAYQVQHHLDPNQVGEKLNLTDDRGRWDHYNMCPAPGSGRRPDPWPQIRPPIADMAND